MAWVVTLGPSMGQIEYRLDQSTGCSLAPEHDGAIAYRMESDRPLEWIGDGLREVGIAPGSVLDDDGRKAALALADGRDPASGRVLVAPKVAVDPLAKLPALPLVRAVREAAEASGQTPGQLLADERLHARYERLLRGVAREEARASGQSGSGPDRETVAHRAPVTDLEAIAKQAGVDIDRLYPGDQLATARAHKDVRVPVGNRGYDLTLDLPKSYSVLMALAPADVARDLEDTYLGAVRETVTAMQGWAGYGMRGHHGDGQTAARVDGTGLLGWMTVHRTARPVDGRAPDPHLHAHVTLLNLVRGTDGKWSTIGAGGRDIHRHAHAADAYLKARLRQITAQRWGIGWARDERTGAWEIAAVPAELRTVFSKRAGQVAQVLEAAGVDPATVSTRAQKTLAARIKEAKLDPGAGGDLRADWRTQATAAGVDPEQLVAAAMPGPGRTPAPEQLSVAEIGAHVFRAEDGLTAHRKVTTRADVLAAVMDAVPAGISALAEGEQLADRVLAEDVAVALPPAGQHHLSNAARYTSADIVHAERAVLAAARDRYAAGWQTIPDATLALAVDQFEAGAGFALSDEQRAVLTRLATGGHGVDAVIGVAGAGKTTIMAALRAAYEATGRTVAGAGMAAVAAQNLQTEAGITSRTVASWLLRIEGGRGLSGVDVLVLDEAATVDDRDLARLLDEAGRTGTKLVMIGDPLQLKAVGVGGTFAAVHTTLGGLELSENRRQTDVDERQALAVWRAEQRRAAVQMWADTDRLHVTATPGEARTAIVAAWNEARPQWADPYERIEQLLMLAHLNVDVDALNQAARTVRMTAGELGPEHTWQAEGGAHLAFAVGDVVMARANDRDLGVLNGHRGIVTQIDPAGGRLQVTRRQSGPDGPELVATWLPAAYIEQGSLQLAYAITAAKAQGLTADEALVYGHRMDANVLYPAMSRDRERTNLWLALQPLEDDADRARLGPPASDAEALQRAVDAYTAALEHDQPDRLVTTELGDTVTPPPGSSRPAAGPDSTPQVAEPTPAEPARPTPGSVAYWDLVAQRLTQVTLPDAPAHPAAAAASTAALAFPSPARQFRARVEAHRADMLAELHRITEGGDPSGRYSRTELTKAVRQARAGAVRDEVAVQVRAMVAQAAGQIPAGAADGHVAWQRRPHGTLPAAELAADLARFEDQIVRATVDARRELAEAQQLATLAVRGDGAAMTTLVEQRDQLAARVEAGRQAEQLRAQADQLRQQARATWDEVARLDRERARNPLALRLAGTSRAEIAAQQEQLREQARTTRAAADRTETPVRELDRQAGGRHGADQAAAELAQLTRSWDQRTADANTADRNAATRAVARAGLHTTNAETWTQQAAGLQNEARIRDRMDPTLARVEDIGRRLHEQRQAEAEADRGPHRDHHAEYERYRPPPTIDRDGPSLGR